MRPAGNKRKRQVHASALAAASPASAQQESQTCSRTYPCPVRTSCHPPACHHRAWLCAHQVATVVKLQVLLCSPQRPVLSSARQHDAHMLGKEWVYLRRLKWVESRSLGIKRHELVIHTCRHQMGARVPVRLLVCTLQER